MHDNKQPVQRGNTALAVKAGFWYVVSNFLTKGLAFITTPIFARLMSSAAYGEFSNYASWQATLLILTSGELFNTLSRAYYDYTDTYDEYVSSVTICSCTVTAMIYLFFLLNRSWIFSVVSIPEQYVHILFITLMFQSCKSIFVTRERTLYRYKTVAAISILNLLIPTLIAVALVVFSPEAQRLSARIYGFYVPSVLIGVICTIPLLARGKVFRVEHCKYAFGLSIPMLVHYFTAYLLTSSNTIITKSVLGAHVAAIVSIAGSTIHILTIVFQSTSGALTTWLMDNLVRHRYKKVRSATMVYVGLLAAMAIGVILLAPEVIWILGGSKYTQSVGLVPGMVAAVFIQSSTSLFTIILTYDKNIIKTAVYTTVTAALSILAKIVLLRAFGYQVLPYVNIAAFGALFIINYMIIRKAGYAGAVNIKAILLIILAVCAVMAISPLLYAHLIVRYAVVVVFGVALLAVICKRRQTLMSFIKPQKRQEAK